LCACGAAAGGDAVDKLDASMAETEPDAAMATECKPVKTAEPVACKPVACVPARPAAPVACTPVACTAVDCTPVDCEPVACTPTEPEAPAPVAPTLPLTVYSVDDPFCRISNTGSAHDGEIWGCRSYPLNVGEVRYPTAEPRDLIGCNTPTTWPCGEGSPAGCVRYERRFVADVPCPVDGQCTVWLGGKSYAGKCVPQTASQIGVRAR
jgi:hypothetical protein